MTYLRFSIIRLLHKIKINFFSVFIEILFHKTCFFAGTAGTQRTKR